MLNRLSIPSAGKWLATATLLLLSTGLLTVPASAQEAAKVSLSISPTLFEFSNNPGETRTDVVKVGNATDQPQDIEMEIQAFTGTETGEARVVEDGDPAYSLNDWVTFSPKKFTLAPRQTKVINFTIAIPKLTEAGGRYGTILVTTPESKLNSTGAATVQKVGALVLMNVRGPIEYSAYIKDFYSAKDSKKTSYFEKSPVSFTTRIHNNGTVHIKPKGFITVSNSFGKKIEDISFPEKNALPKSDRLLEVKWDKKLSPGRYTATLLLVYGDKGEQLTATTAFIVFPWKTGGPIILGSLLVLWFIIARRRNIKEALRIIFGRK